MPQEEKVVAAALDSMQTRGQPSTEEGDAWMDEWIDKWMIGRKKGGREMCVCVHVCVCT